MLAVHGQIVVQPAPPRSDGSAVLDYSYHHSLDPRYGTDTRTQRSDLAAITSYDLTIKACTLCIDIDVRASWDWMPLYY